MYVLGEPFTVSDGESRECCDVKDYTANKLGIANTLICKWNAIG